MIRGILVLALSLCSFAASAIVGGKPDSEGLFPSTVYIKTIECSATKIADHFYLSAAHCFGHVEDNNERDFSDLPDFMRKVTIKTRDHDFTATMVRVYSHPSFGRIVDLSKPVAPQMRRPGLSDAALLEVQETLDIPNATLSFASVTPGESIYLAGFGGQIDPVYDQTPPTDSQKIGASLAVASRQAVGFANEFLMIPSKESDTDTPVYAFSGDSGGSVYAKVGKTMVLSGIISWGLSEVLSDIAKDKMEVGFVTRLDADAGSPAISKWLCSKVKELDCN